MGTVPVFLTDDKGNVITDDLGNPISIGYTGTPGSGPGFPSGTYTYGNTLGGGPLLADLLIEAYQRCGLIGVELTSKYVQSGRRSINLVLSSWANTGPNLWTIDEVTHYVPPGVGTFYDDPSCITILPDSVFIRQYQMGAPVAVIPQFATTAGSTSVIVSGLAATPSAGQYISVGVMVSVGGIILDGIYPVVSVPGSGQAMITSAVPATQTVGGIVYLTDDLGNPLTDDLGNKLTTSGNPPSTTGVAYLTDDQGNFITDDQGNKIAVSGTGGPTYTQGVVPQFVTTANSSTITVNFPNSPLLVGQPFYVEVATSVGGVTLTGPYPVTSVLGSGQFTIVAPYPAGFADTEYENGGNTNLATQATVNGLTYTAFPEDIMLYPLSRGEWESIPVKRQFGRPTTFWVDRQITPVIHLWPVPNVAGPWELHYRRTRQVQDADIVSGQVLNVPYRWLEPFVAALALHLSMKWAVDRFPMLKGYAAEQFEAAAEEDIEKVSTYISPDLSAYFN